MIATVRRRRVRRQGLRLGRHRADRAGRPGDRPSGPAGADPRGRLPHRRRAHADRAAGRARRHRRRSADRAGAHQASRRVGRVGGLPGAGDLAVAAPLRRPEHPRQHRTVDARRAPQHVHAGARRGGRHVRAGVGDGRAGRRAGHRPGRAADAQRAGPRPAGRQAVLPPEPGEAYARGAERFGWADRDPQPGSMRDGRGWSAGAWPRPYHPAIQLPANVTVRLARTARCWCAAGSTRSAWARRPRRRRSPRDALGVPVEAVTVEHGDTALPVGPMAGGSAQTASVAASLLRACEQLRVALHRLARRAPTHRCAGTPARRCGPRRRAVRAGRTGRDLRRDPARAGRAALDVASGSDTGGRALAGQVRFMAGSCATSGAGCTPPPAPTSARCGSTPTPARSG